MSDDPLTSTVHRLIREHFPLVPAVLSDELRFNQDLRADSLSFVAFVTDIETELHVRLPDSAAAAARTVGQLVAVVADAQRSAGSDPTTRERLGP